MLLSCFTLEILSKCRETIVRCDEELYDSSVFQIFFSVGKCHIVRSSCLAMSSFFFLSLFSGADIILTARPQVSLHAALHPASEKKRFMIFWNLRYFLLSLEQSQKVGRSRCVLNFTHAFLQYAAPIYCFCFESIARRSHSVVLTEATSPPPPVRL